MRKIQILCLISSLFLGCTQNNFYHQYQVDDLWRLPLIKPYELKNVAGAKPEHWGNDNWHLLFKTEIKANNLFIDGLNLTMINIDKNIIYGFGTKNPGYHFLINCTTGEEKIFKDSIEWKQTLEALQIDSKQLFDIFEVFENFKTKDILPWDKVIDRASKK